MAKRTRAKVRTKRLVSVRLDAELVRNVDKVAGAAEVTRTDIIETALHAWLDRFVAEKSEKIA